MLKKRRFRKVNVVKVTFSLSADTAGETVHVVGDFTDWQGRPMQRQKDGTWRATLDLAPGSEYQFRYLVDGERWINDPEADRYEPNPFGDENSVVTT